MYSRSLQEALHEPAVEYYTSHSKRVRRKRNRQAQSATSYGPLSPPLAGGPARPLRPEGWNVRYEFKMACFAEFRGEYEVALKWVPVSSHRHSRSRTHIDTTRTHTHHFSSCLALHRCSRHGQNAGRRQKSSQTALVSRSVVSPAHFSPNYDRAHVAAVDFEALSLQRRAWSRARES
jgi:hypothetical protein